MTERVDAATRHAWSDAQGHRWAMSRGGLAAAILTVEASLIVAVAIATGVLYHLLAYGDAGDFGNYITVGALTSLVFMLPLVSGGQYRSDDFLEGRRSPARIFVVWNIAFLCLAFIGLLTKTTGIFSRGWLVAFYVTGLLSVTALEGIVTSLLESATASGRIASRRLMLVGSAEDIRRVSEAVEVPSRGFRVVAAAALPASENDKDIDDVLGSALDQARKLRVEDVVILADWSREPLIERIVAAFGSLPVAVHLGASDLLGRFNDARMGQFGAARALSLTAPPLTPVQAASKRVFDVVIAAVALALLAPLFLAIAILIRREGSGPVFFRQRRRGYNLEEFRIWKFRTMTSLDDGDVIRQAASGDVRVTRVGKYLRRWNLDELPLLINVLSGDMSLVGPRPHAVAHDRFFETRIERYQRRLNVKPGITGWAQVNGLRGPTETEAAMRSRVEYDLYYIDNWSLWFDIYIMIATIVSRRAFKNAF